MKLCTTHRNYDLLDKTLNVWKCRNEALYKICQNTSRGISTGGWSAAREPIGLHRSRLARVTDAVMVSSWPAGRTPVEGDRHVDCRLQDRPYSHWQNKKIQNFIFSDIRWWQTNDLVVFYKERFLIVGNCKKNDSVPYISVILFIIW